MVRNLNQRADCLASAVLQTLEQRMMLASDPLTVTFSRGVLTIIGSANDDQIVVSRAGSAWTISNSAWSTTRTLAVTKIAINAKAGNDSVSIDSSVTLPITAAGDLGNDTLVASSGASALYGNAGDDSLVGGSGNDLIVGDLGNDTIIDTAGNNKIAGGAGSDTITTGAGNDTIAGDADNDTIDAGNGNNAVSGGLGNDLITAGSGADALAGDAGNDTLLGGAGNDTLLGSLGDDSLDGEAGNDFIQGGLGNDVLVGGSGVDTLDYADHTVLQGVTLINGTGGMTGENDSYSGFEIVRGSAGHDDILHGRGGNDTLIGAGGADKLYGGIGNDSLDGGAGNDSLYGDAGNDIQNGGTGDDLLIAVGGGIYDIVSGGDDNDTFWIDSNVTEGVMDASADEIATGAVHRVGAFANKASKELLGQAIADPILKGTSVKYRNFKLNPLFATGGPSIDDVRQGQLGDCYFLAQIGSFAKLAPELIQQAIVDFGDGTYGVQFKRGASTLFYRLDADLPSYSTSALAYAAFGAEGSIWVAMLEKAWAMFRTARNSFASIEAGFMTEVASAFGQSNTWGVTTTNPSSVLALLKSELDAGKSVTIGTYGSQAPASLLVGGHAYSVESIIADGAGGYTIVLRNPWAVDGYTSADGVQDGYVTLSAAQFTAAVQAYAIAAA
jgi:Ca2+-binding RTX toxin-like protein